VESPPINAYTVRGMSPRDGLDARGQGLGQRLSLASIHEQQSLGTFSRSGISPSLAPAETLLLRNVNPPPHILYTIS
jgi:hypothetical protein